MMTKQLPPSRLWLLIPFLAFGIGMLGVRNAWVALVLYHLGILLALFWHQSRWQWRDLLRGFHGLAAAALIGSTVVMVLPLVFLGQAKGFTGEAVASHLEAFGLAGIGAPLFVAYFVLLNPPLEELFWRQLFYVPNLWPTFEDVAFGAFHFLIVVAFLPPHYALVMVAMGTLVAWSWRSLRRLFNGVSLPTLGLLSADAASSAVAAYLVFSPTN